MKEKSSPKPQPQPKPMLRESGFAFSLAVGLVLVLSLILSFAVSIAGAGSTASGSDWYIYLSYLVPQVCFAVAALVWFRRTKCAPRRVYRPCKWYFFPLALLLQFGLLLSLGELNSYLVQLLSEAGYHPSSGALTEAMLSGWYLLPTLIIVALLPALFEETLFRGILIGGMRDGQWGTGSSVLITGLFFALMHGSPEQTVYQFVCGCTFALLCIRSGSVLPGMLAHFINNAVIITLSAFGIETFFAALPLWGYVLLVVLAALSLAGGTAFLILSGRKEREAHPFAMPEKKSFFLAAAAGLALCAVQWIAVLISGFGGG